MPNRPQPPAAPLGKRATASVAPPLGLRPLGGATEAILILIAAHSHRVCRATDAPTVEAQAAICREMQRVSFETVPFIPTGVFFQPTAYRKTLADVRRGFPQFYGVRRV